MAKKDGLQELTKFEKARVIGARALQLSMGAPPLIKIPESMVSALRLSFLEFDKGAIPLRVVHASE